MMRIRRLNRDYNREIPRDTTRLFTEPLCGMAVILILEQEFDLPLRPALILMACIVLATALLRPLSHRATGIHWRDDRSPFQDLLLAGKLIGFLLLFLWLFTIWGPMGLELFGPQR